MRCTLHTSPARTALATTLAAVVAGATVWPSRAAAAGPGVEIPWSMFVAPGQTGPQRNNQGRCAATATINSFVYLSNARPDLYGRTNLLAGPNAGGPLDLQASIVALDAMMQGTGCGVSTQGFWEGKYRWVQQYAPGTTTFHGMTPEDFSGWAGAGALTPGNPTFDFLLRMLRAGEDVELGFEYADGRHVVTLSGLDFDDTNGDGAWDPATEFAQMRYVDPNCPLGRDAANPGSSVASLLAPGGGPLQFAWVRGNGTICSGEFGTRFATVTLAFAESATVPEPSTVVLVAAGGAALCAAARRRARPR